MNAALNGWLLVHWLPGAAAAVFGLALEDTLPTAPTATAPTIVKATNTLDNLFILLMTSVSSRDDRRTTVGHLLCCADRADPGHRLISQDAKLINACPRSVRPTPASHLPTGPPEAYIA